MSITAIDKWMPISTLLWTPSLGQKEKLILNLNNWSLSNNSKVLTALPRDYVTAAI